MYTETSLQNYHNENEPQSTSRTAEIHASPLSNRRSVPIRYTSQTSRPLTSQNVRIMRPSHYSCQIDCLQMSLRPTTTTTNSTTDQSIVDGCDYYNYNTFDGLNNCKRQRRSNYTGFHGERRMKPSPIHRIPVTEVITRYDFSPSEEELRSWKAINRSIRKTEKKLQTQELPKDGVYKINSILSPMPPL